MMQRLLTTVLAVLIVLAFIVPAATEAQTTVNVTFQVNLRVKTLEGTFKPDSDYVAVPGNFNGWNPSADTLLDPNHDSIYTKTITLKADTLFEYKFFKSAKRGGDDWESIPNRHLATTNRDTVLPVFWYNNDSVVSIKTIGNVLFQVDMRVMEQLGIFQRTAGDSVHVRGIFNGWSSSDRSRAAMERVPGTETYQISITDTSFTGDQRAYKYYMQIDSARALHRWSGFNADRDNHLYEHPYDSGDGNRMLTVQLGDYSAPLYYFNSLPPQTLVPAGDTIWVLFRINMKPAMSIADSFRPASDTLFLELHDAPWRTMQGYPLVNTRMAYVQQNDSIWALQMAFIGSMTSGIMYSVVYVHPGGTSYEEPQNGLGVNAWRVRYMKMVGNTFAKRDTFPIDKWSNTSPREVEPPPFNIIVTGVQTIVDAVPTGYSLEQNYPNPFNPATKIRYQITAPSDVRLTVFDMLGREVTTLVNERQQSGVYAVDFNAGNVASGVYYYTLKAGNYIETRKMVLVK